MELRITLIMLISYIVFEFIIPMKSIMKLRFQKGVVTGIKIKEVLKGNIIYSVVQGMGTYIFLIFFINDRQAINITTLILITVIHCIINQLKSLLILYKEFYKESLWLFLGDLSFHFGIIIIINKSFNIDFSQRYDRILLSILIILVATFLAGHFIKYLMIYLDTLGIEKLIRSGYTLIKEKEEGSYNGGFYIGLLERVLIIIVIALNENSLLGFVLATKSIARFKKLENQKFAEYFIIGTFLSFIIAILSGLFISKLNIFP